MKKLFVFIVGMGLLYNFFPQLFPFNNDKGSFDAQGNPATIVFTVDSCRHYCRDALSILNKRNIEYVEYNIDKSEANKSLWKEYSNKNNFPTVITGNDRVYGYYKHRIISNLALNYGDRVLTSDERYYIKKHFNDDGSPKLVMYGATWCPHCKKMKQVMQEEGIALKEINVNKSPHEKAMVKTLEISGFPIMYYGYRRMEGARPKDIVAMF